MTFEDRIDILTSRYEGMLCNANTVEFLRSDVKREVEACYSNGGLLLDRLGDLIYHPDDVMVEIYGDHNHLYIVIDRRKK